VRALEPDETGFVERDGVRVFWERFGDGSPTVLFLPTWSIVHSRCWKAQVPFLARHFRVVTFDPRGNGRSDRPAGAAAYAEAEFVGDALAVMDASGTPDAVLVSWSRGTQRELLMAAEHPDRVLGAAFIGSALPLAPVAPERARYMGRFSEELDADEGWAKWNAHYWRRDYEGFLEFFFGEMFPEPHSTKQIEDGVRWALETDPETLADTVLGPYLASPEETLELCERVACPVLVIHGTQDLLRPPEIGRELAAATGGRYVELPGYGHAPHMRKPVLVNGLLREFFEQVAGTADQPPAAGLHSADAGRGAAW
jgi:pimeloyl-ACP methyl ester carboxylesterase